MSEELSLSSYRTPSWWSRLAHMEPVRVRQEARKVYHGAGVPFCQIVTEGLVLDFKGLPITGEDKEKAEALVYLFGAINYSWHGDKFVIMLKPEQLAAAERLAEMLWPLGHGAKTS